MSLLPSDPDTSAVDETDPRVIGLDSEDADDVLSALTSDTARAVLSELHEEPAPPAELAERVGTSLQNTQYHLEKLEDAGAITVIDQIYSEKGREMNVYAPADQPLVIFAGDDQQSSGLRAALSRLLGSLGVIALGSLVVQELFGDGLGGFFGSRSQETGQQSSEPVAAPTAGNGTATPAEYTSRSRGGNQSADGGFEVASEPATDQPQPTAASNHSGGGSGGDQAATESVDMTESTQESTEVMLDSAESVTDSPEATEAAATAAETAADTAGSGAPEAATTAMSLPPGLLFFLGGVTALVVIAGVWYATS